MGLLVLINAVVIKLWLAMHRGRSVFSVARVGLCDSSARCMPVYDHAVQVEGELTARALVREKGRNSVTFAQDSFPKTILDKQVCH